MQGKYAEYSIWLGQHTLTIHVTRNQSVCSVRAMMSSWVALESTLKNAL